MASLVVCPSCARHVRSNETQCPFCAVALSLSEPEIAGPLRSRAAIAAFAAASALAGCAPTLQQQQPVMLIEQPAQPVVVQQQVVVQEPQPVVIVQQPAPIVSDDHVIVVRSPRPQPVVQPQPVIVTPPDHTMVVPAYGIAPVDYGGPAARYGAPPVPEEG